MSWSDLRYFEKEVRLFLGVFSTALSLITLLSTQISWTNFLRGAGGKGCLTSPACGAKYPGYLMKTHPDNLKPGKSVQATLCFSNGKTCCAKTQQIEITKCKDFFIYKLPRACLKRARYCGNGGKVNDTVLWEVYILRGRAHYNKIAQLKSFVGMCIS